MSIYAVDFDKTLSVGEYKYPDIGRPNIALMAFLKKKREEGNRVILWTCREDNELEIALGWLRNLGMEFDAVNDNVDVMKEAWGNNPRKVFADYYIDDRSVKDYTELLPKSKAQPKEIKPTRARIIRRG